MTATPFGRFAGSMSLVGVTQFDREHVETEPVVVTRFDQKTVVPSMATQEG